MGWVGRGSRAVGVGCWWVCVVVLLLVSIRTGRAWAKPLLLDREIRAAAARARPLPSNVTDPHALLTVWLRGPLGPDPNACWKLWPMRSSTTWGLEHAGVTPTGPFPMERGPR